MARTNLVLVCAGNTSLHTTHGWASSPRTYDLCVVYYGTDNAVATKYRTDADHFVRYAGPKWTLVRHVLLSAWWKQHRDKYAFVAFPDDDLAVTARQWDALFAIGHEHRLDLFQPSLVDNGPAYIKHTHLVTKPHTVIRYTDFVEIMTPVFSRKALSESVRRHVLTDPRIKSGWGVDYVLPQQVLPTSRGYRIAVVDAVAITHTKPLSVVNKAALASSFYRTYHIDPEAEMRYFLRKFRARARAPRVYREVPVPVDYRRHTRRLSATVDSRLTSTKKRTPKGRATGHDATRAVAVLPYLQSNLDREFAPYETPVSAHHRCPRFDTSTLNRYYHKVPYGFHARIRNNTLTVVKDLGGFQTRNWNTVQMLHDVLQDYAVPDCEFLVCTDDRPRGPDIANVPILVMARRANQTYLTYPDHTFYAWPEARTRAWDVERASITNAKVPVAQKNPVAFFRGNTATAYMREYLAKASRRHLELDVADVRVGDKVGRGDVADVRVGDTNAAPSFVSLADHAKWKYLVHVPGISYAARLKYLLHTQSVVCYVHKRPDYEYREFWYDYLDTSGRCVMVEDANDYDPTTNAPLPATRINTKRNRKENRKAKRGRTRPQWDDTANEGVVTRLVAHVRRLERDPRAYDAMVRANAAWRKSFDYAAVLGYWAALLRRYAAVVTA